jgi:hypothetical protein
VEQIDDDDDETLRLNHKKMKLTIKPVHTNKSATTGILLARLLSVLTLIESNARSKSLRRSGRATKPVESLDPSPDNKPSEPKHDTKKKRKYSAECVRGDAQSICLTMSPCQHRLIENLKCTLQHNQLLYQKKVSENTDNMQQLKKLLQADRDAVTSHYQRQIKALNDFMAHIEQACGIWESLRLDGGSDCRYNMITSWLDDDVVRVERLRDACSEFERSYSDDVLLAASNASTASAATDDSVDMRVDEPPPPSSPHRDVPTDVIIDTTPAAHDTAMLLLDLASQPPIKPALEATNQTTPPVRNEVIELEDSETEEEEESEDCDDATTTKPHTTPSNIKKEYRPKMARAPVLAKPLRPSCVQFKPDGTTVQWNEPNPLTEAHALQIGYKVFRLSRDGLLRFYVQNDEPASGPMNVWIPFVRAIANDTFEKLQTRGSILVTMRSGLPLSDTLFTRIAKQYLLHRQQQYTGQANEAGAQ